MVTNLKQPTPLANRLLQLVLMALFGALLFVAQVALSWAANVELVTLLVLLLAVTYGMRTLISLYLFVLVEGVYYGISEWFINYLYVWLVPLILGVLFRKQTSRWFWAVLSGLYGLAFGTLCSFPKLLIGGVPAMLGYIISGFSFDVIHAVSNFLVAFFLFVPLRNVLNDLNRQCRMT